MPATSTGWTGDSARPAAHAFDQPFVDLADQPLGDRLAAVEVLGDQLKRVAVVQQFTHVVRLRLIDALPGPRTLRLRHREVRAFDVRGVVRLEQQSSLAHPLDPFPGQRRCLEEAAVPLHALDVRWLPKTPRNVPRQGRNGPKHDGSALFPWRTVFGALPEAFCV
jgi:hypothetical protein